MGKNTYVSTSDERERVERYLKAGDTVVLVGPTGCGKTTLVEELTTAAGRSLVTLIANPDMTLRHLVGGYVLSNDGSDWIDGPLTHAVKKGTVFYLDEADLAPRECLAPLTLETR